MKNLTYLFARSQKDNQFLFPMAPEKRPQDVDFVLNGGYNVALTQ